MKTDIIRRTLLIGIPGTILILILAWTISLARTLETGTPGTSRTIPKAPCAIIENSHRCSTDAYVEIHAAMDSMLPYCQALNEGVQAWAELNEEQPDGYEVLASCAGTLPAN